MSDATGFSGWQRTWLAVPEATSFVAHDCAAGRMHVDDGVIVEVVDDESGVPVASGDAGSLALTPLGVDTPVLRYTTGLRARVETAPCSCGSAGTRIELL